MCAHVALGLLESARLEASGVVSTQILQEYFVAATTRLGVPAEVARRKVQLFAKLDVVLLGLQHILGAIDLHRLHKASSWDALVLRAAADAGCSVLYSEDLNPGQRIDGVEVTNPFR
ncbi:MAG: PIN domain-containing protein [Gemmatimonadota bacterium]